MQKAKHKDVFADCKGRKLGQKDQYVGSGPAQPTRKPVPYWQNQYASRETK